MLYIPALNFPMSSISSINVHKWEIFYTIIIKEIHSVILLDPLAKDFLLCSYAITNQVEHSEEGQIQASNLYCYHSRNKK